MRFPEDTVPLPSTATGLDISSLTLMVLVALETLWTTSILFPALSLMYHAAMALSAKLHAVIEPSAIAG